MEEAKQLKSGKYVAECANLSGSKFHNVNLSEAVLMMLILAAHHFIILI